MCGKILKIVKIETSDIVLIIYTKISDDIFWMLTFAAKYGDERAQEIMDSPGKLAEKYARWFEKRCREFEKRCKER